MKIIKSLDTFRLNEAISDQVELNPEDIKLVEISKAEDFGSEDTPKRAAIVKALGSALMYFDAGKSNLDLTSKLITASDDAKQQLFDIAQTFVSSIKKMNNIETDEIDPLATQIANILGEKK